MDAEKALTALVGVVAGLLGKNQTELLPELKSGDEFKSAAEIKSYLDPLITAKFKDLVPADKVEQARGKALKDAYGEVEKKISAKFGVNGLLKEDLLDQVFSLTKKPSDLGAEDAKNSQAYKDLVKDHKAAVKQLKLDNQKALQAEKQGRVTDRLYDETLAFLQDAKNNFVLPESESILENQVAKLVNEVVSYKHDGSPVNLKIDGRDIVLRDSDDLPLKDDQMNDISVFSVVGKIASTGYFPLKQASGRRTPQTIPGATSTETTVVKFGGDKQIEVPAFSSKTDMTSYLTGEGAKLSPAERVAIRNAHDGKFDEPE